MVNIGLEMRYRIPRRLLAAGVAMALLLCRSEGFATAALESKPACDYQSNLDNPDEMAKYLSMKQEMELIAKIRTNNLEKDDNIWTMGLTNSTRQLDDNSRECIACHERKGKHASSDLNDRNHPGMSAVSATHAIGTDYISATAIRGNLRRAYELPPGMTLVNGRIACITCHNPLNPQRLSLAVDTTKTSLCFACHIM